jgi:DNA repair protein RadD
MGQVSLSRNFIGKHLSITEQEDILSLHKVLVSIDACDAAPESATLSKACITALPNDFLTNKLNTKQLVHALGPANRSELLRTLDESKINDTLDNPTLPKCLHELCGIALPSTDTPKIENRGADTVIETPQARFKDLKPYQVELAESIWNHLHISSHSKCILQMPTGTGKTRTSIDIACRYFNTYSEPIQILWLCNTEELADQAYHSFIDTYRFLAKRTVHAQNCMRSNSTIGSDIAQFLVCSIQSISDHSKSQTQVKLKSKGINLESLRLVILDEAHIASAPTYRIALETLTDDGVSLLGLTATPGRASHNQGDTQNTEFAEFFNKNVFSLEFPGVDTIEELVSRQIMSRSFFHPIEGASIDYLLSPKEIEQMHRNNTIPKKLINIISQDQERNATIVSLLNHILRDGKRVIYFGTSVAQSKLIANMLGVIGHPAMHIDGASGSNRQSVIQKYRNQEINCICNYGVLSTGFDAPSTDVVFIARITNSIVLYSQMIGRGLRGKLLGGTDVCDIYTVVDNIADLPENREIYSYFRGYFEAVNY